MYYNKYLKYKTKYLDLKSQSGGDVYLKCSERLELEKIQKINGPNSLFYYKVNLNDKKNKKILLFGESHYDNFKNCKDDETCIDIIDLLDLITNKKDQCLDFFLEITPKIDEGWNIKNLTPSQVETKGEISKDYDKLMLLIRKKALELQTKENVRVHKFDLRHIQMDDGFHSLVILNHNLLELVSYDVELITHYNIDYKPMNRSAKTRKETIKENYKKNIKSFLEYLMIDNEPNTDIQNMINMICLVRNTTKEAGDGFSDTRGNILKTKLFWGKEKSEYLDYIKLLNSKLNDIKSNLKTFYDYIQLLNYLVLILSSFNEDNEFKLKLRNVRETYDLEKKWDEEKEEKERIKIITNYLNEQNDGREAKVVANQTELEKILENLMYEFDLSESALNHLNLTQLRTLDRNSNKIQKLFDTAEPSQYFRYYQKGNESKADLRTFIKNSQIPAYTNLILLVFGTTKPGEDKEDMIVEFLFKISVFGSLFGIENIIKSMKMEIEFYEETRLFKLKLKKSYEKFKKFCLEYPNIIPNYENIKENIIAIMISDDLFEERFNDSGLVTIKQKGLQSALTDLYAFLRMFTKFDDPKDRGLNPTLCNDIKTPENIILYAGGAHTKLYNLILNKLTNCKPEIIIHDKKETDPMYKKSITFIDNETLIRKIKKKMIELEKEEKEDLKTYEFLGEIIKKNYKSILENLQKKVEELETINKKLKPEVSSFDKRTYREKYIDLNNAHINRIGNFRKFVEDFLDDPFNSIRGKKN